VAALKEFPRQALHAAELKLRHPQSGRAVEWNAPLPQDLQGLLAILRRDSAKPSGAK
jgi:23S rRNA pseudouridine1911/1915/1917 synthase